MDINLATLGIRLPLAKAKTENMLLAKQTLYMRLALVINSLLLVAVALALMVPKCMVTLVKVALLAVEVVADINLTARMQMPTLVLVVVALAVMVVRLAQAAAV